MIPVSGVRVVPAGFSDWEVTDSNRKFKGRITLSARPKKRFLAVKIAHDFTEKLLYTNSWDAALRFLLAD